jgi:hypothetical protein
MRHESLDSGVTEGGGRGPVAVLVVHDPPTDLSFSQTIAGFDSREWGGLGRDPDKEAVENWPRTVGRSCVLF